MDIYVTSGLVDATTVDICKSAFNPIDPKDLPSNMWYFPRISQNSLKIPPTFKANIQIQSLTTHTYLSKQNNLKGHFIGFNLIYWTSVNTFWMVPFCKKCGKIWKNTRLSGRLRLDWGNTAWVAKDRIRVLRGGTVHCCGYMQKHLWRGEPTELYDGNYHRNKIILSWSNGMTSLNRKHMVFPLKDHLIIENGLLD